MLSSLGSLNASLFLRQKKDACFHLIWNVDEKVVESGEFKIITYDCSNVVHVLQTHCYLPQMYQIYHVSTAENCCTL